MPKGGTLVDSARPALPASRYRAYLLKRRQAGKSEAEGSGTDASAADEDPNHAKRLKRSRPFKVLFREFSGLLRGSRGRIALCLVTVTLSALFALITPASTKIAIDYILTNNPGPSGLPDWVPTRDPKALLWYLGIGLMTTSLLMVANGMYGRLNMTRLTHILRARIRRRVFNHAVRLPLHRVYQIKSGGAASMLREDAGQSADLLFSLMYNPWRAVVQLVGTLCILAYTDWRLLLGATVLIPLAWFSQKAWIARIRPVFRAVRATRTGIDAHATEA
ncbi:MAG: ABC transporter ATP-binding protein, partial [Phycisphaerales bacterium]|nr:ABC transporter ATP-binding protein [Phycisphaerales bacterium]